MLNHAAIRGFLVVLARPTGLSNTTTTPDNRCFAWRRLCADFATREQPLCASDYSTAKIADDADAPHKDSRINTLARRGDLGTPAPGDALPRAPPRLTAACDVNGCVVPEAADESSGFGGIISPPWWDDFQEP